MESIEDVVTVSPKYQVVVPKKFREKMRLEKGEKMAVTMKEGKLVLERIPDIRELIGKYPELKKGPSIRELRREADKRIDRL